MLYIGIYLLVYSCILFKSGLQDEGVRIIKKGNRVRGGETDRQTDISILL